MKAAVYRPDAIPAGGNFSLAVGFAACIAVGLPALLAFNLPPSATFLNQAAALGGWGLFMLMLTLFPGHGAQHPMPASIGLRALVGALVILAALAFLARWTAALPSGLALSSAGSIGAAIAVVSVSAAVRQRSSGQAAFEAFCLALLATGALNLAIALIQYFDPSLPDGDWLARPGAGGRVGGNLRQPNHLSSLLLWSLTATVWLHAAWSRRHARMATALNGMAAIAMLAFTFGVVLTVSRTGAVCIVLLALWGVLDRQLPRFTRVLLWLLPLFLVVFWVGMTEWAAVYHHAFAGDDQLHKGDLSSSRFGIWKNTLALIAMHPWAGVGWGEFNFAWTLTPFPGRPVAFFDHTHNLLLQLAVEIGIPLTALVMGLVAVALMGAFKQACRQEGLDRTTSAAALVMVLMIGIHSLLEYPLWYAYFLLPAAFAFGAALGRPALPAPNRPAGPSAAWVAASAAMVLASALSVVDYQRVVQIFSPDADAPPLGERIAAGQRSWFFAHHADYAAVTTATHPSQVPGGFDRAAHYLLDARLMIAWSKALAEQGDLERARYVAERLREFNHPLGATFFAECDNAWPRQELPFQCTPPSKPLNYLDFRKN